MVSDSGYNFNGKNDCSERAKSDCKRQFIFINLFFYFFCSNRAKFSIGSDNRAVST